MNYKKYGKYPEHYTPEIREALDHISQTMESLSLPDSELSKASGVPAGTVSLILSGKYPSRPTKKVGELQDGLNRLLERLNEVGKIGFAETSVWNAVKDVCEEALTMRNVDSIGLICGHVGIGKTTSLKEYARRNPNAIYMRASVGMTKSEMLIQLMGLLNLTQTDGTISAKQGRIARAIRGRELLIILDEATRCSRTVLECLRDISDDTETALVFAGREQLYEMFSANGGDYAEISSRILTRIPPIRRITKADCELITRGVFSDLDDESMEMIYQCSQSNARELQKLITKVGNYRKNKGEVTPEIISKIWQSVIKTKSPNWRSFQ